MAEAVRYWVRMSRPHSHLFEVEARFPALDVLDAVLPVWTPGSYLLREFARHVQDVSATDESGQALRVERTDKRTWRVESRGRPAVLRYRVYANELTVRTSHLDGTHGYFNGATLFLHAEALRALPHRVRVEAPPGWGVFSALDTDGQELVAPDHDTLVDSPVEVGPHQPLSFVAANVPHQVVVWGEPKPDAQRLVADLKTVCETEAAFFGSLPLKRYLFLIYLTDKGRGGLEHMASTTLLFARSGLQSQKGWEDFLTLASHEYFHLWNVKRIKPRALVPFRYGAEAYTRLLWAFEGTTSYYDNLLVRRAGLMAPVRYLTRLGEALSVLAATPGRRVQTLEEASLTAWVKYYRPDENSVNSGVSYYLKGELVALCLDLTLRQLTGDAHSLDDVMRLLWERFGDGRGVPENGVEAAAAEVAGQSLQPFFDRALRSTEELDDGVLGHVGLEVHRRVRESAGDRGGTPPRLKSVETRERGWLGVVPRSGVTLASVLEGSPAMEAGLYAEDEVLALDGERVDAAGLISRCDERAPGTPVTVQLFRRDRLVEVTATLGSRPADAVWLARVEQPTEAQKASYQRWMGAPWEES
ncbi:MAG: M61 family metallopeptidase [Myxococcaceae bacterium]